MPPHAPAQPSLPSDWYTYSLASAALHLAAASVTLFIWRRSCRVAHSTMKPWALRHVMLGLFIMSNVGRIIMFVLEAPVFVCSSGQEEPPNSGRKALRAVSAFSQAIGFYGHCVQSGLDP